MRGEYRADQRARSGDGGEVVAEENPFIGGLEIVAVAQPLSGRRALIVERHHTRGDELGIEAVADGVTTCCRQHKPQTADVFASIQRDAAKTKGGDAGNRKPKNGVPDPHDS